VRWRSEAGFVGGYEALPFGFLVFVAGTLLLVNAWAVVDGKLAASAAAREGARAFAESPGPLGAATEAAEAAAEEALAGHGRDPERMVLDWASPPRFERCARVVVEVTYRVPTLTVPWIGAFGDGVIETSARHSEVVDPFRSGVPSDGGPVTC
jgi:hypothetical protein